MIYFTFYGWFECGRELSAESVALFDTTQKNLNENNKNKATRRKAANGEDKVDQMEGWEGEGE